MKQASIYIVAALTGCLYFTGANAEPGSIAASSPAVSNSERKAILNTVRQEIKKLHDLQVVFVVKQLTIRQHWAWFHALPQSRDGKERYEDIVALLHKRDGQWQVMEIPCAEEDNPDCLGSPEFSSRLQQRFKGVPAAILPH